jgi:hypothetical protein
MSNFDFAPFQGLKPTPSGRTPEAQEQGSWDPPDRVGLSTAKRCEVNQGIVRPAYMREQANPQIDADIAEKGHFWMETNYNQ